MSDTLARLAAALAGRYRVERELGAGGMATVFLAHDEKHDRDVAIKVLHPDLGAALGSDRFLSEIKTTAKLQHPHILPLLDSGEADGLLFYVMPVVTGESLRARLERERQLPIPEAVRLAREVAQALDYAHRHGVIHRDVKPENVLLHDGSALVADFGIALAVQTAGGTRLTQTGLSLGTPQYMSPEQAMGERTIDARSDQYALAAMTYEMLTGDPPFSGSSVQAIVAKVLSERPTAVRTLRDTVPPHVEAAVLTGLNKLPADRFATLDAFARALAGEGSATLASPSLTPGDARRPRAGRVVMVGVALVTGALAGAGGWVLGHRSEAVVAQPELHLAIATNQRPDAGMLSQAAGSLSPDGRLLAYGGADSAGKFAMWLLDLSTGRTRMLRADLAGTGAFSPDGRTIAMVNVSAQQLEVMPVEGGTPRVVNRQPGASTWLDDSTLVQATDATLLRFHVRGATVSEGEALLPVVTRSLDSRFLSRIDDQRLAFVRASQGEAPAGAQVMDVRTRAVRSLGIEASGVRYVSGGILLYRKDGAIVAQRVDSATLAFRGAPEVIVGGGDGTISGFTASRNGIVVVRRGSGSMDRELVIVDRKGRATPLFREHRAYLGPRFSPDGNRIAYIEGDRATNGGPVFIADARSGARVRVTLDDGNRAPEWTRDGRSIVLVRGNGTKDVSTVRRVSADGGPDSAVLFRRMRNVYELQVAPDGSRILWREDVPTSARDLYFVGTGGDTVPRPLRTTRYDERGLALSPDGTWYAYTSNETGQSEVYLSRLDDNGPRWPISRGGGVEPRWTRSGEIFFRRGDSVFVTRPTLGASPSASPPTFLFAGSYMLAGYEPRYDVSPDGQRFAMVRISTAERITFELVANWRERFLRTHP